MPTWVIASLGALATALAACSRDTDPRDASKAEAPSATPTAPRSPQAEPKPQPPTSKPGAPTQPNDPRPIAPPGKGATAVVGKARLQLHGCGVEAEWPGGERRARVVDLPGGCVFVATGSGAQVEKTEQGDALLVVSSHPLEGRPGDCDTRVRAVVLHGEGLAVSSEQQVIRMCGAEGPFDSMLFHTLAASAKGAD
jgi:hypothetical protein